MKVQLPNHQLLPFIPNQDLLDLTEVPYFWNLNSVSITDKQLSFTGWALPYSGLDNGTRIMVNGNSIEDIVFEESEEVARLYPWWPNARRSSFSKVVSTRELVLAEEELIFEAVPTSPKEKNQFTSIKTALYFNPSDLTGNFPDEVTQSRIGSTNIFQFSMAGLTLYHQFKRVFEQYSGQLWTNNKLVIDWGCGSGRVARHIIKELNSDQFFLGLDIDKLAIDWANGNIAPFFKPSEIDPPLPIDTGAADIILAYSVLTHLAVNDMRKWIKEISRVTRKGGYFIFTILSDTALIALMPYAKTDLISKFRESGIYDTEENSQLESMGVSGEYYRNVWLRKELIKREIEEYFEMIALERNFHYYQDVVICKRK